MNALDAAIEGAQLGYEAGVREVAASLQARFGRGRFEGVGVDQLPEVLTVLIEQAPIRADESQGAAVIRDLFLLQWWCGLVLDEGVKDRLGRLLRRDYRLQIAGAALKRPRPDPAARRRHVVFAGALNAPLHSPSLAGVGYLLALAADIKTRRLDVFHYGEIHPALAAQLAEQLPAHVKVSFRQIEQHPDFLAQAVMCGPATYHFWCYPRTNVEYSFMAMFGPTVMFTCADDPPMQYADVYWASTTPDHIRRVWSSAPPSFPANYVPIKGGSFDLAPPARVRTKSDLGLGDGEILLASVGNRLAVDLDEDFVSGVEAVLRQRSNVRWLVVGALPERLLEAMRTVLGRQFLHVPFDPDLPGLMVPVDLWLNPFRRGGGHSAVIAARAGAPVLTRADIGDVASCIPAEHSAADSDDYFIRLNQLLDDPSLRQDWSEAQQAFLVEWLDSATYARELERLTAIAFERFRARAGHSLDAVFPDPALAAVA